MPHPALLSLPAELRHSILAFALYQPGTRELQYPIWTEKSTFILPTFQVNRLLRKEALQAYYQSNTFVWTVDATNGPDKKPRSDPTNYPLHTDTALAGLDIGGPLLLTVPWCYPYLMQHLRRVVLNFLIPCNRDGELAEASTWIDDFPAALRRIVETLNRGRRLDELSVYIIAKKDRDDTALLSEEENPLEALSMMQLRGRLRLRIGRDAVGIKRRFEQSDLERRMKEVRVE